MAGNILYLEGANLMELSIDRSSRQPLYRQVVEQVRKLILTGALPAGFRLPPERRLATTLGVNRTTILNAYRELKAEGLVDSHVGRGTAVLGPPPAAATAGGGLAWAGLMRGLDDPTRDPLLRDLLAISERRDVISLSIGLPAPELLPARTLADIFQRLVDEAGGVPLLHCPTEGHSPLRASIASWLVSRGIDCGPEEVIVLSGSQQGLDLIARLLLAPGDEVVVEDPTYIGALSVFRAAGVRLLPVETDHEGLRTDVLAGVLERHRPRLIYTLPTFQNPSGFVMSPARRRELITLAERHRVPVLEDDPYSELRYDGDPTPALRALDGGGVVLYLSTFSKLLFPGLRIGFLVAPRQVVRRLALIKQHVDLHAPSLGQWLLDRFLRDGHLGPHLSTLRRAYAARRDALADALRSEAGDLLQWRLPRGGFYLWCRCRQPVVSGRLLSAAAAAGISFLPGATCTVREPDDGALRLNFSYHPPDRLTEGAGRLAAALRRTLAETRSTAPTTTPTLV